MSFGGLFLMLALLLWFLLGLGVRTIPNADAFASCCLVLGILLGGIPLGPWWRSP